MRGRMRLDLLDDFQRGRAAVLEHREQGGARSVVAHDVGLHRVAVADVGDVADVDRGSVGLADGQAVEGGDGIGRAVELDGVFLRADLHRAGRHDEALRVDGVGDVFGGDALSVESARVEIH